MSGRLIIETSHEGICIVDAEGRFSFVSAPLEQMLGYGRGELLGESVLEVVAPDARELTEQDLNRRRQGIAETGEVKLHRKDGGEAWVLRSASPIFDDEGRYEGVFGMLMDITERKRVETSLRRTEEQLRHAQKMEAVGRLAGGVAHDFNNLLSVIFSYAELLVADLGPGDPMTADLGEICTAAKKASGLTRQLLQFSRQQVIEPKVLDLNDLLLGVHRMLLRVLGADVDLVLAPAGGLGRVRVDPGSIEQVIMNLVVNARDAMSTGGKLTMETANVVLDEDYARAHLGTKPGAYVMLAVTDTGTGMDRSTEAHIFEPFFTTKGKDKGTGLGLSTAFGIVQQAGGHISVQSEPGRGTTFKIHLPRVDAMLDALASPSIAAGSPGGSETILLVEDDDQVRAAGAKILRRRGYDVLVARDAAEAMFLSQETKRTIHLLVTDVVMPRMNGPELAERLVAERPNLKVLCISGYPDDSVLRNGVLESGVAYLQKPLRPEPLWKKVREVLDAAPRRAP